MAAILHLIKTEIAPFDPSTLKTLPSDQTWSGSDHPLRRYGHSKFDISRWGAFGTPFGGKGRSWGVIDRIHWKERCWFHIRSPLWPLRYIGPLDHSVAVFIECLRRSNQRGGSLL